MVKTNPADSRYSQKTEKFTKTCRKWVLADSLPTGFEKKSSELSHV